MHAPLWTVRQTTDSCYALLWTTMDSDAGTRAHSQLFWAALQKHETTVSLVLQFGSQDWVMLLCRADRLCGHVLLVWIAARCIKFMFSGYFVFFNALHCKMFSSALSTPTFNKQRWTHTLYGCCRNNRGLKPVSLNISLCVWHIGDRDEKEILFSQNLRVATSPLAHMEVRVCSFKLKQRTGGV